MLYLYLKHALKLYYNIHSKKYSKLSFFFSLSVFSLQNFNLIIINIQLYNRMANERIKHYQKCGSRYISN